MQIWPRNTETERLNVNHIVDMINIEMFTIESYSISRDDQTWLIDMDHVIIYMTRGMSI